MRSEATKSSKSHAEALQGLADEYFDATGSQSATTKEIASWAIREGKWEPPPDLVLRKCREEFAKAMREQCIHDESGGPVRAKHVARVTRGDVQTHLWADIRTAPRRHMMLAFQQRREQIVGDCRQLSRDVDYYNRHNADVRPVQMVFDFTEDIAEAEFSPEYPPKQPR